MLRNLLSLVGILLCTCVIGAQSNRYDRLIKNGTVYAGTGRKPQVVEVAIAGDKIVAVGKLKNAPAKTLVEAQGLAVAPGFVNMLSHSYNSILQDPRSLGELRQGVTTQIFGEGASMGPLSEEMKKRRGNANWTTLAEYLKYAEQRGISQNIAPSTKFSIVALSCASGRTYAGSLPPRSLSQ